MPECLWLLFKLSGSIECLGKKTRCAILKWKKWDWGKVMLISLPAILSGNYWWLFFCLFIILLVLPVWLCCEPDWGTELILKKDLWGSGREKCYILLSRQVSSPIWLIKWASKYLCNNDQWCWEEEKVGCIGQRPLQLILLARECLVKASLNSNVFLQR